MIALRSRKPLLCRELVELVTDYLEGTLSRRDRARFDSHIAGCPHCTAYLAQFRETLRLTGTLRTSDVSPEAEAALLEAFASWKNEQGT
jgi:anti-sigma factor RsiW